MALLAVVGLGVFFIPHDWARMVGAGMFGFASAFAFVLNLVLPPLLAETSGDRSSNFGRHVHHRLRTGPSWFRW
jgi:hypothetical protein